MLEYVEEQSKVFTDALSEESDRALGIIAVCWLDNLLEKLLRAYYVKDPQIKLLFKDDHILQTFSAKVNIAYFSGLIPKFMYHDLKLMGVIRNRFAQMANMEKSGIVCDICHNETKFDSEEDEFAGTKYLRLTCKLCKNQMIIRA